LKAVKYIFLILFQASLLLLVSAALAQGPPVEDEPENPGPDDGVNEKLLYVPDVCEDDIDIPIINRTMKPNRVSGNVIRCIEKVVTRSADRLIDNYIFYVKFIVFNVIVIAILVFFVRVMFGVVRTKGITLLFCIKIFTVLFLTNPENTELLQDWRDALIEWPQDMSLQILKAFHSPVQSDGSASHLLPVIPGTDPIIVPNPLGNETDDVFDYLDVYMAKFFGIDITTIDTNQAQGETSKIYVGAAAMAITLLFTGPAGPLVAALTVGFVLTVIFAIAQAVLFFCTIIIAVNFLIAISPIAVTCMLFESTKKIFKTYCNYLLIYVTQPILLMAILGMVLGVLYGVVDEFKKPHELIYGKILKNDGSINNTTTIVDCSDLEISGEFLNNIMSSNSMRAAIVSGQISGSTDSALYRRGLGGTFTDKDKINLGFGSDCEIEVPTIKLDYESRLEVGVNDEDFSERDLQKFMGLKLGVIAAQIRKSIADGQKQKAKTGSNGLGKTDRK